MALGGSWAPWASLCWAEAGCSPQEPSVPDPLCPDLSCSVPGPAPNWAPVCPCPRPRPALSLTEPPTTRPPLGSAPALVPAIAARALPSLPCARPLFSASPTLAQEAESAPQFLPGQRRKAPAPGPLSCPLPGASQSRKRKWSRSCAPNSLCNPGQASWPLWAHELMQNQSSRSDTSPLCVAWGHTGGLPQPPKSLGLQPCATVTSLRLSEHLHHWPSLLPQCEPLHCHQLPSRPCLCFLASLWDLI